MDTWYGMRIRDNHGMACIKPAMSRSVHLIKYTRFSFQVVQNVWGRLSPKSYPVYSTCCPENAMQECPLLAAERFARAVGACGSSTCLGAGG